MAWKTSLYHKNLSFEFPAFLRKYSRVPCVQRLKGIGLLCGTDWTKLFHNNFFYSRFDHSVGVALIIWNFTKDKKQALAGLFHDVATRAFSHVIDFKNGDALRQESTEDLTSKILRSDRKLARLLKKDGISYEEVEDYKLYPVADNEIPNLSADRLEYMYPSGAALDWYWTLEDAVENNRHVCILRNERGQIELGFDDVKAAEEYCHKFQKICLFLQTNTDKVTMQLLADVVKSALENGIIQEQDLFDLTEKKIVNRFVRITKKNPEADFSRLFRTFANMKQVLGSEEYVSDGYCVSVDVKKRYINPLVINPIDNKTVRVSEISPAVKKEMQDFLEFRETKYGFVRWC